MMIEFTKLEALGNDFVLVDARNQGFRPTPAQVRQLADRRKGIGFDQLLILRDSATATVRVDIHNHDGSHAEQCGNGMRAIALFLQQKADGPNQATLETPAGPVIVTVEHPDKISAELPAPDFEPPPRSPLAQGQTWTESIDGMLLSLNFVNLGNPHLVIELDQPASPELLALLGPRLSQHQLLPDGANISLAHVIDDNHVVLSVFERGVGPTLACGSGACATAVSLIKNHRLANSVKIDQPGGHLVINWPGSGQPITMTGPARRLFDGHFDSDTFFK